MKYVLELLRGNTTYNSRSEAISALDNYPSHRAGQPVVVIYKKNGNSRALLAIGTGPRSYTIIGDADGSIDITSKISARDIVLDEIDYSGLLKDLGDSGEPERFGWLGTKEDPWLSTKKIPSGTTVQEAFEAILVGRAQDPEPEPEPITYTVIYKCEGQDEYIDVSTGTIPTLKTAISEWNLLPGQTIKEWKNSSGDPIEGLSQDMFTEDNNYTVELTAVLNILELKVDLSATVTTEYDGEYHSYEREVLKKAKNTIKFTNNEGDLISLSEDVYLIYITGWNYSAPDVGFREFKDVSSEPYQWANVKVKINEDYDHLYSLSDESFESSVTVTKATLTVGAEVEGEFSNTQTVGDIKELTRIIITGIKEPDDIEDSHFSLECRINGSEDPLDDNIQLTEGQTYTICPRLESGVSVTGSVYDNYEIHYNSYDITVALAPLTVTSTTGNYGVEENEDGKYTSESDIILAYDYFNDPQLKSEATNNWDLIIQSNITSGTQSLTYNQGSAGIEDLSTTYMFLLNRATDKFILIDGIPNFLHAEPTTISINRNIEESNYSIYIYNTMASQWEVWDNYLPSINYNDGNTEITINTTEDYTGVFAIKLNNI